MYSNLGWGDCDVLETEHNSFDVSTEYAYSIARDAVHWLAVRVRLVPRVTLGGDIKYQALISPAAVCLLLEVMGYGGTVHHVSDPFPIHFFMDHSRSFSVRRHHITT